jgi:hypothetical protein
MEHGVAEEILLKSIQNDKDDELLITLTKKLKHLIDIDTEKSQELPQQILNHIQIIYNHKKHVNTYKYILDILEFFFPVAFPQC